MNRNRRRSLPKDVRQVADNAHCPDCNSEARVIETVPGVFYLQIHHDDTCPWFATYRKAHNQ